MAAVSARFHRALAAKDDVASRLDQELHALRQQASRELWSCAVNAAVLLRQADIFDAPKPVRLVPICQVAWWCQWQRDLEP